MQKEIDYENSTYKGSPRLVDLSLIANFPDTLPELWPHTANFGPDFRHLMDHLFLKPELWVLDIGTGPCWSCRLLAQTGARVIALDVNDSPYYGLGTADLLFSRHGIFFERILESMTRLPFKADSIDRITFNASLHHTPDLARTLRECHRVLKPGGLLAMVNEEFFSLRQRLLGTGTLTDLGSHHALPYSLFEREAQRAGFQIKYLLAGHVRRRLEQKLPGHAGRWLGNTLEAIPPALKQLNSALILLSKPLQSSYLFAEQDMALKQHA